MQQSRQHFLQFTCHTSCPLTEPPAAAVLFINQPPVCPHSQVSVQTNSCSKFERSGNKYFTPLHRLKDAFNIEKMWLTRPTRVAPGPLKSQRPRLALVLSPFVQGRVTSARKTTLGLTFFYELKCFRPNKINFTNARQTENVKRQASLRITVLNGLPAS